MSKQNQTRKDFIIDLWNKVDRPGVHLLIEFLEQSDFFEAPCSTEFHLAEPGGLARHSLNVYRLLEHKTRVYAGELSDCYSSEQANRIVEATIICGLGHDFCKINTYKPGKKNVKIDGRWVEKDIWRVDDSLPLGHGEKSAMMLQRFIQLTDEELAAIRWHMCAFDASIHFNYPNGFAYRKACEMYPLVTLLFTADFEASNIVERRS